MTNNSGPNRLADDILRGATAIGEEIGESASFVYHASRTGKIPTFKLGKHICARRSTLIRKIEEQEASR